MREFGLFLIVTVAFVASDSVVASDCGTTFVVLPRIVWGRGADGIRMGQTEEFVRNRLGEPDGDRFIDWYGTSHGFQWDQGPHAGLRVTFVWRPDNTRDVGLIELVPPYKGLTVQGIGIGSARAEVECIYRPSERPGSPDNWYAATGILHWVMFEADTVVSIWMLDSAFVNQ